ncbi:MAG TPA: PAN domain-containing protein [Thermoanaerobaculia bacterium]|nr:PAN domain-containing protein [Thermoanaerobaculia bacterium]
MRSPFRLLWIITALAVSIPLAAPAQDVTEERGVNRRGSDYKTFDAYDVRDCIRACERDSRCEAYAYNNLKSICYLKDRVPNAERDGGVTSGVKRGSSGGSWGGGGRFSEERGVAYRGEDYSKFLSRGQEACERECRRDNRCVGYTFNLRTDMCFLKDRLGRSERDSDTVSGVKGGSSGGGWPGSGGNLTEEWNLAYRGDDYSDFRSTNLQDCKDACRRDRRCVAYTYNHRSDVCYLKDRLGRAERDDDTISGTKGGSGGGRPGSGYDNDGGLTQEWGVNRPGSDYSNFRADDAGDCQDACRRDRRCRAYAFNTRDRECYLKDRVPSSERKSDVVSGVKDRY